MRTIDNPEAVLRRLLLTTAQAWHLPTLRIHRPVSDLTPHHRWPSSLAHVFHSRPHLPRLTPGHPSSS